MCFRDLDSLNTVKFVYYDSRLFKPIFPYVPFASKIMLSSKVPKNDLKIIFSFHLSESVTHTVEANKNVNIFAQPHQGNALRCCHIIFPPNSDTRGKKIVQTLL